MKLIVISDPDFITDEAKTINSLFESGMECFHLRKPESNAKEMSELIELIYPVFYNKLALHQHHVLANQFGIFRLHFTEQNRLQASEETLLKLKAKGYIISTSMHDLAQMNLLSPCFDYTFFGPVFDSISKSEYPGILDENFYLHPDQKRIKLIALGGINDSNMEIIRKMNFDGAAVLGALWQNPSNAVAVFRELMALGLPDPTGSGGLSKKNNSFESQG